MYNYCDIVYIHIQAKEQAAMGNLVAAKYKGRLSLRLNIAAIVIFLKVNALIIGVSVGVSVSGGSADYSYYDNYYYYDSYYYYDYYDYYYYYYG